MRAIMVMYDSLNRRMLPPYGCDWVQAPNFQRLAQRSARFNTSYVCSMPCMPARRDLHTARPNFLHRSWGPLEPFDDSVPAMLVKNGIHCHLATDHAHYFEDGGCTYHNRYSTWHFSRGQEGDPWVPCIDPPLPAHALGNNASTSPGIAKQDRANRTRLHELADWPQYQTFKSGIDAIRSHAGKDNWFVQIETFDPHEPFYNHPIFKDFYARHFQDWQKAGGPLWDWPAYDFARESRELVEHMRFEYAALVSMCDAHLGMVLDEMDRQDLWKDTMLIVWTDHGFLLGEHESWAKCWLPFYEEVARTPFFVWDPRSAAAGVTRDSLVQPAIDLGPTLLDWFGLQATPRMTGCNLRQTIANDQPVRQASIFGIFGGQVNVTDGRYVYMRGPATPENSPLHDYTLMPTHMRQRFSVDELAGQITLADPFPFTQGCSLMRIPSHYKRSRHPDAFSTLLFDLHTDPQQQKPIHDAAIEARMTQSLLELMQQAEAPSEQYQRLGLKPLGG